ncbi:dienelactone hydrolase family protein [Rhodococcus chondri]|uniref:Dienelactone hydrolase family protein n=1 Tax=Rhodococcus chondri TaxID=3065941 RepID=A0ABU7JXU5_9NOCA|nr:dienelactone hydrolase family protein [Rhodococcus sp. CC-R104]MEE2034832.1 dienelactone hydrolase family protein [Rhodococcus sp. CC-R104]
MTDIEADFVRVGDLHAYLARPATGTEGGMLLLPPLNGIDEQVREYAADIAASGVTALVWDPWHGPSLDGSSYQKLLAMMGKLDDETCLAEMNALLDHAFGPLGLTKVGVIGWCLGGRLALILAGRDERLANVVAYHPSIFSPPKANHTIDTIESATAVTAPVMVLHAGADTVMSTETFADLQGALQSRRAGASIIHVYPGAEHAFSTRARHSNPINAAAYAVSWPQVLQFVGDTTR